MAKFSSADSQSYESIASFIVKLAYCQSLQASAINSWQTLLYAPMQADRYRLGT